MLRIHRAANRNHKAWGLEFTSDRGAIGNSAGLKPLVGEVLIGHLPLETVGTGGLQSLNKFYFVYPRLIPRWLTYETQNHFKAVV